MEQDAIKLSRMKEQMKDQGYTPFPDVVWRSRACQQCKCQNSMGYLVINEDHGDERHKCFDCGYNYVIEGPDS